MYCRLSSRPPQQSGRSQMVCPDDAGMLAVPSSAVAAVVSDPAQGGPYDRDKPGPTTSSLTGTDGQDMASCSIPVSLMCLSWKPCGHAGPSSAHIERCRR